MFHDTRSFELACVHTYTGMTEKPRYHEIIGERERNLKETRLFGGFDGVSTEGSMERSGCLVTSYRGCT
jgi:hypothetical protein